MKAFEALLLDLDRTLLDGAGQREAIVRAGRDLARAAEVSAAHLLEENGRVWRELWPEVEPRWNVGELEGDAISAEAWRRTLARLGFDDPALVALVREAQLRHEAETFRLYDDARTLLALPGLPRVLVTNGAPDTQRHKLAVLGIEERFDAVVISGELGVAKPDVAIFRAALDHVGVAPDRALHVGDNLRTDVAGAQAAGLTAVWLNRTAARLESTDPRPDYELRSLSQLANVPRMP